jgi:hypothetical protein
MSADQKEEFSSFVFLFVCLVCFVFSFFKGETTKQTKHTKRNTKKEWQPKILMNPVFVRPIHRIRVQKTFSLYVEYPGAGTPDS